MTPDFFQPHQRKTVLATPNYGYEKRQRELAKKQKKEEKLRAKAASKAQASESGARDGAPSDPPAESAGPDKEAPTP